MDDGVQRELGQVKSAGLWEAFKRFVGRKAAVDQEVMLAITSSCDSGAELDKDNGRRPCVMRRGTIVGRRADEEARRLEV